MVAKNPKLCTPVMRVSKTSPIRAESQDAVPMVPAVAAMQERYRELRLPVTIMAGTHDRQIARRVPSLLDAAWRSRYRRGSTLT